MKAMAHPGPYRLVIDLDPHPILGMQGCIYVCSSEGELPAFALYKLSTGNAADHGIETASPLYRLLLEAERFTPANVLAHFNRRKKVARSLEDLLQDPRLKKALSIYTQSRVHDWLSTAVELMLPIGTGIRRDELVRPCLLRYLPVEEPPRLHFKRTTDGLHYRLSLYKEDRRVPLITDTYHALSNEYGWSILGTWLLHVPALPALFLKPFTTREEVYYSNKHVPTFMQGFLLRVAKNAEIEAEGFDVEDQKHITAVHLCLSEDVFNGHYKWRVNYTYGEATFQGYEDRRIRQRITETSAGSYKVHRYIRDKVAEEEALVPLASLGLRQGQTGWLDWVDTVIGSDLVSACCWLIAHLPQLQQAGIQIDPVQTPYGTLVPEAPVLEQASPEEGNDWFDLRAQVTVGDVRFPFTRMYKTLLERAPFHPLPDGRCMLVPAAWQSEFAPWFASGIIEGETLRLTKAQYRALQETRLTDSPAPAEAPARTTGYRPPSSLQAQLRSYQVAGFSWLATLFDAELGACLADDMGLGKTIQTIALLLHIQDRMTPAEATTAASGQLDLFAPAAPPMRQPLRALIIAPAGLLYNWASEIAKFAPALDTHIHRGSDRSRDPEVLLRKDVLITSYPLAVRDAGLLAQLPLRCIVLDESHQIKNRDTQTFKAVARLQAPFRLTLTGTPVENSLSDLWSQMQFINPGLLGGYTAFRQHFQVPIEKHNDEAARDQLRRLVNPYILRRMKRDVLTDLPPVTHQIVYCDMDEAQAACYHGEKNAVRQTILQHLAAGSTVSSTLVLNALMRLRQIAIHPALLPEYAELPSAKTETMQAEMDTIARSGHRGLVFSNFLQHLAIHRRELTQSGWRHDAITGEQKPADRLRAEHAFQAGDLSFLLITLKAGGTGLNLTAADYVLLADPWWNPAAEQQAIDRAHRIGQQNPVVVMRFITRGTIEEKILRLQERKLQWSEDLFDEHSLLAGLSPEEVAALLD
jgi:superfamily II DNA or RNA helicase